MTSLGIETNPPRASATPAAGRQVPGALTTSGLTWAWLIRLRWLALLAFLALPLGSTGGVGPGPRTWLFLALILAMAGTNVALARVTRWARDLRRDQAGAVLVLDTGLLTGLLYLSGGATNPGTVVYLGHITFAAVLLGTRWAWVLTVLSVAGFGSLFLASPMPSGEHVHGQASASMESHVFGMWVAFAATAALIAHFVSHVASALAARERELADLRAVAARNERLAALTTLAAGAAHELSTPLSTIAVTAREIGRTASGADCPHGDACRTDAALISKEVARCHRVLDALSGRARGRSTGIRPLQVPGALEDARASLNPSDSARVDISSTARRSIEALPHEDVVGVLVGLLRNALDASSREARIMAGAAVVDGRLEFTVTDSGTGMTPDVLAHVDEPFFTTKPPGQGLGLGVFLARTVTEQLGGQFTVASTPGVGTTVTLAFPVGEPTEPPA